MNWSVVRWSAVKSALTQGPPNNDIGVVRGTDRVGRVSQCASCFGHVQNI